MLHVSFGSCLHGQHPLKKSWHLFEHTLSDWNRDKLGVELALFLTGVVSATSLDPEAVFIHQFY